MWQARTGTLLNDIQIPYSWSKLSPDGKLLAVSEDCNGYSCKSPHTLDPKSGQELFVVNKNDAFIRWDARSNFVWLVGSDATLKLRDLKSGRDIRTAQGFSTWFFYSDGSVVLGARADKLVTFRSDDLQQLQEIPTPEASDSAVAGFLPGGSIWAYDHRLVTIWDAISGTQLGSFHGGPSSILDADRDTVVLRTEDEHSMEVWDLHTGKQKATLSGHSRQMFTATFNPDGRLIATGTEDGKISVWDIGSNELVRILTAGSDPLFIPVFSPNGKLVAASYHSEKDVFGFKVWDAASGRELYSIPNAVLPTFSPDSKVLAVIAANADGPTAKFKLFNVSDGTEVANSRITSGNIKRLVFGKDNHTLIGQNEKGVVQIWDYQTAQTIRERSLVPASDFLSAVSPDGRLLAYSISDKGQNSIRVEDVMTGQVGLNLGPYTDDERSRSLQFSPDGKILARRSASRITFFDVVTGREISEIPSGFTEGDQEFFGTLSFTADSKKVASVDSAQIRFFDVYNGLELGKLVPIDQDDWAVVDPAGRFDASPGAQKLMHFVVGVEPIALQQLKERYYEPGLLSKIFGFNKEPLRDVSKFENPKLNPDVRYEPVTKGSSNLRVTLTNRGGGIGRVQVFVNGKEFLADARGDKLRQNPNIPRVTLSIDLSGARGLLTGKENNVRVIAWNVENYISSRGSEVVWTPDGPADRAPPEVYAIIGGISKYAGPQLNLNFAAKDAVDIANAIELGAKRLFGTDKVHLSLLSTADDPRAIAPTKDNFTKAFEAARKAKPTDILIVYLAGHGITLQRGSDTYCYLTKEARTTDTAALSDTVVRKQETITSEELVDWIKQIPALKQVVMLDTCAAGAAQAQLKLVDKRDASGDAIRAIDRAKDRTGSYILMGSAADAVSYEASQYGQGLLTYALLKGMKGAALRNDEFIDVSKLFLYAREEVEQLAKNVGGIQRPIIFSPKDDSFEVGQLNKEDKLRIFLATPKPMILRPRFFDAQADDDTLDLMKVLRARLRDESFITSRGGNQSALVFVDDDEFPGGIRPTGRYTIEGSKVTVTLRLRRDGLEIGSPQTITGTKDDLPDLATKVLEVVKEAIKRL